MTTLPTLGLTVLLGSNWGELAADVSLQVNILPWHSPDSPLYSLSFRCFPLLGRGDDLLNVIFLPQALFCQPLTDFEDCSKNLSLESHLLRWFFHHPTQNCLVLLHLGNVISAGLWCPCHVSRKRGGWHGIWWPQCPPRKCGLTEPYLSTILGSWFSAGFWQGPSVSSWPKLHWSSLYT